MLLQILTEVSNHFQAKMGHLVQQKLDNVSAPQDGKDSSVTDHAATTLMVLNVVKNVFVKMEHLVTHRMVSNLISTNRFSSA